MISFVTFGSPTVAKAVADINAMTNSAPVIILNVFPVLNFVLLFSYDTPFVFIRRVKV